MKIKEKVELYIYECERCGRKNPYSFGMHAPSKLDMHACNGKVRRIKWKNAW